MVLSYTYQLVQFLVRPQNPKTWLEKGERTSDQTHIRHVGQKLTTH